MKTTREKGKSGEDIAAKFLEDKGYEIKDMNYHSRYGEIDIIAIYKNYICFVEVKQRKNAKYAEAREFVTPSKQKKIIQTALMWLAENNIGLQPRFDVMEIYTDGVVLKINHIENAFE